MLQSYLLSKDKCRKISVTIGGANYLFCVFVGYRYSGNCFLRDTIRNKYFSPSRLRVWIEETWENQQKYCLPRSCMDFFHDLTNC